MGKQWNFDAMDDWLNDVATPLVPELTKDEYDVERSFPYVVDSVPRISYVELAWLGYYTVRPEKKTWAVETCDGMVFRHNDRRQAVREAQTYCTSFARGEKLERHLPKPLRPITVKVRKGAEPPF